MTDHVLITGGLGYVGGRVARTLAEHAGFYLRLTTRQISPVQPPWLKHGEVVPLDLGSAADLKFLCRGVRYVVHLAALNENDCESDPEQALMVNGLGTLKLLQAAEHAGVERFIYFSTAHVYGAPLIGTITEATLPRPVHPYAITHRTAEDFVLAARERQSLTGIVLRLSNAFGVPVHASANRWTLVTNDLCRQAVTDKKLTLQSPGLQSRDFITLSDVSQVVLHLLRLPASKGGNGLYNLGGECSLRIIDWAERIAARCSIVLGYTPVILRPEAKLDDAAHALEYCSDKLKATGFLLTGDFDAEIDATLQFCRNAFGID